MKVVLTEDVRKVGARGDVVEVSDGYGRNFLMARGLAVAATAENLKRAEENARAKAARDARERHEAEDMAARLDGLKVSCPVKAGEKGKLYGSVSTKDIADAVNKTTGYDIDRHDFDLKEQIKSLGIYDVPIRLYPGITAVVKIEVIPLAE